MGLLHNIAELIAKQAGRFSAIRELLTYRHASLENIVVEYEIITVFENKLHYFFPRGRGNESCNLIGS